VAFTQQENFGQQRQFERLKFSY